MNEYNIWYFVDKDKKDFKYEKDNYSSCTVRAETMIYAIQKFQAKYPTRFVEQCGFAGDGQEVIE